MFKVIDNNTGKEANKQEIALNEKWAKEKFIAPYEMYEHFAITENGEVILIDELDNIAYAPDDRFRIVSD